MARSLERLGRASARHRWRVVAIWLVAAAGLVVAAVAAGGTTNDDFSIPGTPSQEAEDLLEAEFPAQAGGSASVVFQATTGSLGDTGNAQAIGATQANLEKLPGATSMAGPATPAVGAAFVSGDGKIGYAVVQYDEQPQQLGKDAFDALEAAAEPAEAAGLRVEFGGPVVDYGNEVGADDTELIGLLVAVLVLLFAFGSVVAMGLPIGTALFGLGFGLSLISLLSAVTNVGTVAPTLATMIGLGVGIDYSLFIVTRYRQNLARGLEVEDAIGLAAATSGQAVLLAGTTVVVALCGVVIAGIPYVSMLGITAAMVVAVMMTAALTLLPALLGFAGHHIDSLHVPRFRRGGRATGGSAAPRQGASACGPGIPARSERPRQEGEMWARWARFMARHKVPALLTAVVLLGVLTVPFFHMRLGITDDGTDPESTTQRQAYDLIAEGFGAGANGPLLLAIALPQPNDTTAVDDVEQAVTKLPGVRVAPPQVSPNGRAAVITVIPPDAPDSEETTDLVNDLRSEVLPPVEQSTGAQVQVGGVTASFIDLGDRIEERLPLFIGAIVGVSFLLLMIVFHSVLVPLTAAVMNLLSIGAAYGVIVAVFQWGWAKGAIGLEQTEPIVAFVPLAMFAILFGLSMDYEVFLLSRIREAYSRTGDNSASVVEGISQTARVITSAALIMISVFLAFVPNPNPVVKMFGLGLAVAVAIDSTIVRLVLVPTIMELLGKANWWFPRRLDRILPKIEIE